MGRKAGSGAAEKNSLTTILSVYHIRPADKKFRSVLQYRHAAVFCIQLDAGDAFEIEKYRNGGPGRI